MADSDEQIRLASARDRARRLMSVAEVYGSNSDTASDLSLGALDDLASSSGSRTLHRGRGHRQRRRRQADQVFLHRAPEEHFPAQELILAGCEISATKGTRGRCSRSVF